MKKLLPTILLLAACSDDDFVAVSRLDRLRVLALRSEPVTMPHGEPTTLEPLVYRPGDAPVTYRWSWCPLKGDASDGYRCPLTDEDVAEIAALLGVSDVPPLELGREPTQVLTNPFPAETLARLCRDGFAGLKPDCDDGFPIRVMLRVESGGEVVDATTVLQLPITAGWEVNENPVIDGVEATIGGQPVVLGEEPTPVMSRLVDHELKALVDPATAETITQVVGGVSKTTKERLSLGWFAETGELEDARTAYLDGKTAFEDMLENSFRVSTSDKDPGGVIRLYVVVRDQRGGVAWTTGRVRVEETP